MGWRDTYKVHPAADVFPMMSDEELDALAADIRAHTQRAAIVLWSDPQDGTEWLIDGRNRLEAMERAGIPLCLGGRALDDSKDPVTTVLSMNLHRRHMLKSERADAIVALAKIAAEIKPGQDGPVSEAKGGRGKRSAVKAKAQAINADLPKEQQVSERTIKRAMAKAEGRTPKPKPDDDELPNTGCNYDPADARGETEDDSVQVIRRRAWLNMAGESKRMAESFLLEHDHRAIAAADPAEIDDEILNAVTDAFRAWRDVLDALMKKETSTLPQDGRSDDGRGDPIPMNGGAAHG